MRIIIEDARQALFDTLYLCKFPNEDEIDANGFRQLVTSDSIEESIIGSLSTNARQLKLGVDVASGGDDTVFVLRNADVAWVELKAKTRDTMTVAVEIERIMETYKVAAEDVFVDDIGVGRGVCDRLHEKGLVVNGISVGEKPLDGLRTPLKP